MVTRTPILMIGLILLLIGQSLSPLAFVEDASEKPTQGRNGNVWIDGGISWPQFGRTPGHESAVPPHDPTEPESGELLVKRGAIISEEDCVLLEDAEPRVI